MSWKIPKTVLGDKIEWDLSLIPGRPKRGRWTGKDDQLWRCRKTKKFEASLLNNLPHGASFVDAGAHFGDTVMTMALYARDTLRRDDIRFVAFEPNPRKARFIEECAAANGFSSENFRVICCVLGDETSIGGAVARRGHGRNWCEFDGRTSYTKVMPRDGDVNSVANIDDDDSCGSDPTSSCNVLLDVHRLDDYYDQIHPLGFLHIDVEGWEARVIAGASFLLTAFENPTVATSRCYVLAETFSRKEARSRGPDFSDTHEDDILKAMSKFSFTRGNDVVDIERNLFFARGGNKDRTLETSAKIF